VSALVAAVRLLTVIPVPFSRDVSARAMSQSAAFFPLVGLGIGGAVAGVAWAASLVLPPIVAAGLVLLAGVVLTGALHLDGLADTADGLFGGRTPERRLEIMRDPHVGVFGAVAIGAALILKFGALSEMAASSLWVAIVLAPMLGRLAAAAVMAMFRNVNSCHVGARRAGGTRRGRGCGRSGARRGLVCGRQTWRRRNRGRVWHCRRDW
jgi:adenosylcobinamide-GDP ribazoletransferase